MSQPNIDFIMGMTKDYLDGKIEIISFALDFPYELEKRYKKMHREDSEYCDLIYDELYDECICQFDSLSDSEFKKLVRKKYNYIKKIAREGFW